MKTKVKVEYSVTDVRTIDPITHTHTITMEIDAFDGLIKQIKQYHEVKCGLIPDTHKIRLHHVQSVLEDEENEESEEAFMERIVEEYLLPLTTIPEDHILSLIDFIEVQGPPTIDGLCWALINWISALINKGSYQSLYEIQRRIKTAALAQEEISDMLSDEDEHFITCLIPHKDRLRLADSGIDLYKIRIAWLKKSLANI